MLCWRLRFAHGGSQARGPGHSKHTAKENNALWWKTRNLREQKTLRRATWLGITSGDEKHWSNPSLPSFALSIFRHGSQLQANVPKCFEILRCFKRFLCFNESSLPQAFDLGVERWVKNPCHFIEPFWQYSFSSLDREHFSPYFFWDLSLNFGYRCKSNCIHLYLILHFSSRDSSLLPNSSSGALIKSQKCHNFRSILNCE